MNIVYNKLLVTYKFFNSEKKDITFDNNKSFPILLSATLSADNNIRQQAVVDKHV